MQQLVHSLSATLARRDLKRRREQEAELPPRSETDETVDQRQERAESEESDEREGREDEREDREDKRGIDLLSDAHVSRRLLESHRKELEGSRNQRERRGATFLLRLTMALFTTVQMLEPLALQQPLGVEFAALLTTCFSLARRVFHGDASLLGQPFDEQALCTDEGNALLKSCIFQIGAGRAESEKEKTLIMAARGWSRLSDSVLEEARRVAYEHVTLTPALRVAAEAILLPARRGFTLF